MYPKDRCELARREEVLIFKNIIILFLYWGYIVAFTKALTIYHS
jgi:hypothetical protein